MNQSTEQDKKIVETILCKICENPFKDPIILPCSDKICYSHFKDFIKVDQKNHQKSYFDCCFCNQQHPIVKEFEFIANKSANNNQSNITFSELQNECKQLLEKLINSDRIFQPQQKYDLSEYFADLRSKVDLKRKDMILGIQNASDDLINEINEIEKDYFKKLDKIYSDFDLDEFNRKVKNYERELNKNKISLKELIQINEKMKRDFSQLVQIRKNSNKLVSSKAKIKFKSDSVDRNLKDLFGQIINNALYGRLISGSDDKSIKIWDLESCECIKTITDAHAYSVISLELLEDDKFASGSSDNAIKIWDMKTFECLKTLNGHFESVICLKKINQNEIMSGSDDLTIKIWDLNSGDCIKTLQGHTRAVKSLEITNDKKRIVSCSYDKTIKIWSYENGECLKTLIGHSHGVKCLQLMKNKIISGSEYSTIKVWNIDSGECEKTLTDHRGPITCIKSFKENQFLSGSLDGEIKLWEIERGICLMIIKAHDKLIWVLEVSEDGKIFSGSGDKSIKIWDMESGGECIKTLTDHLGSVRSLIHIT